MNNFNLEMNGGGFLNLRYKKMSDEALVSILKHLKNTDKIRKIDIRDNNLTAIGILNFCSQLEKDLHLEELYIGYNQIGQNSTDQLFKILSGFKYLKKLYINDSGIDNHGIKSFVINFKHHNNINHLDFSSNKIGIEGAAYLGDFFATNNSVSTIYLSYNGIGVEGVKLLFEGISCNTTLKTIYIRNNDIKDEGLKIIAKSLEENNILESLNIGDNNISDVGVIALCNSLYKNQSIKSLNLGRNDISEKGAHAIGKILLENKPLEHLNIGKNIIADNGVSYLSEALKNNTNLLIFNVRDNKISDIGAEKIGQMLQQNSKINILNVCDNQIGDRGIESICNGLKENSSVKFLYITNNEYSKKGTKLLNELQQNLEVVHFFDKNLYYLSAESLNSLNHLNRNISNDELKTLFSASDRISAINIQGALLNEECLYTLANYFNKNIIALNLSNNSLDARSAKILSEGLRKCSNLKILELKNNNLGREGAKYIAQALEGLNPEFVDMSYNYVGFEFIEEICQYHNLNRLAWTF